MKIIKSFGIFFIKNFEWFILFLFTVYYAFYTYTTMANVVFLGWFFQISLFEKYFNGFLSFSDFLSRFGEHGMLGYNLLSFINLIFFKWNTLFDAYLNVVIVFLTGLIFFFAYKKSFSKYGFLNKIMFVLPVFVLFSIIQQSSASMETQIRLGLLSFFFTLYILDIFLFSHKKNLKSLIGVIILFFISINIWGTFYSFAWIPGIFLYFFSDTLKKVKKIKNYLTILFFIFLFCFLYFIEYWTTNTYSSTRISESIDMRGPIRALVLNPIFSIKWMFSYLGSSTFGRTLFEDKIIKYDLIFILNGLFVFLLYIYSSFRFFISKMNKKTFLPLLMMSYTFLIGLIVMLGRVGLMVMLGNFSQWIWGSNYWYAVHTKIGLSACIWILLFDIDKNLSNYKKILLPVIILFFILASQLLSTIADWKRAPWVKKWYEEKISYILNPNESLTDLSGYTPLVISYEDSIKAISFLKKYDLNVFSDIKKRKLIELDGWYGDDWVDKEALAIVNSKNDSNLAFVINLPNDIFSDIYKDSLLLEFYIDGEKVKEQSFVRDSFVDGSVSISIEIPKNKTFNFQLKSSKSFIPADYGLGEDLRELSVLVEKIELK